MSVIDLTSDDDGEVDLFSQALPASKRRKIAEPPAVPPKPEHNPFNKYKLSGKKTGDDTGWIQTRASSDFGFDDLKENGRLARPAPTPPKPMKKKEITPQKTVNRSSAATNAPRTSITLGACQNRVLELIFAGQSVFFTGCAGTGKSTLLKHIISSLPKVTTYITASTGIAAVNIGGTTLHSFAGVGKADGSKLDCLERAQRSRSNSYWKNAKTLIIDEISMVDADLLDKIDYVGKVIRHDGRPFGGVQLIVCGDFLQLPPVAKGSQSAKFCFESPIWSEAVPNYVELEQVYRQSDNTFISALAAIRRGQATPQVMEIMQNCLNRKFDLSDGIEPTMLFPLNRDVDSTNDQKLAALPAVAERIYQADDRGTTPFLDHIQQNCAAPARLALRPGAQVMLLANLATHRGLVTGARGVVVGFDNTTPQMWPRVKFRSGVTMTIESGKHWTVDVQGKEMASRRQLPLKLAWALSIHRCQGQTLDRACLKLDNVFEYGQAYVALSRVTSMESLQLLAFNPGCIRAHPRVLAWYDANMTPQQVAPPQPDVTAPNMFEDDDYVSSPEQPTLGLDETSFSTGVTQFTPSCSTAPQNGQQEQLKPSYQFQEYQKTPKELLDESDIDIFEDL